MSCDGSVDSIDLSLNTAMVHLQGKLSASTAKKRV